MVSVYACLLTSLQVVSGLTNSAVSRLLQTFDKLPASVMKRFENLKSVVSMDNNYRRLREVVHPLPYCLPFDSVFTHGSFFKSLNCLVSRF